MKIAHRVLRCNPALVRSLFIPKCWVYYPNHKRHQTCQSLAMAAAYMRPRRWGLEDRRSQQRARKRHL